MKVDRTKYTVHRENGIVVAQWVSIEMALDGENGDSPLAALDRSMELEQQWYQSKNLPFEQNSVPHGPPPIINVERTSDDKRIAELIRNIYACTEIEGDSGLLTYNKLASTCKEAQQAFDIMFSKLAPKSTEFAEKAEREQRLQGKLSNGK
jgi:hypothetical protein